MGGDALPRAELPEFHPFKSREARDRYLAFYDARAAKWPVPSQTRTVRTDQGDTFVRTSGTEGAPPLVLLNGIRAASVMSPPQMIVTLAERYRLYTMDRPWDVGRSVWAGTDAGSKAHVAWLSQVLDALGIDRLYLLGVSLGAWVAAEFALAHPERVAKMVWMMPSGIIGSAFTRDIIRNMPAQMRAGRSPSTENVRAMLGEIMRDGESSEGEVQREYSEFIESMALGMQCFQKLPLSLLETNRRFSDAELRGLRMPLLYLAGEHETFSHPEKNRVRLAKVAPHARAVVIPGVGHDLISLKPAEAARHICEFLEA